MLIKGYIQPLKLFFLASRMQINKQAMWSRSRNDGLKCNGHTILVIFVYRHEWTNNVILKPFSYTQFSIRLLLMPQERRNQIYFFSLNIKTNAKSLIIFSFHDVNKYAVNRLIQTKLERYQHQ